jgi:hypothetical protein
MRPATMSARVEWKGSVTPMGRVSNRKKDTTRRARLDGRRREEKRNGQTMTLRIQADVAETHPPRLAKLVMQDVREARQPLVVFARNCPPTLTVGETAIFTGELEMRFERMEWQATSMIMPVLTVQTVEPATELSPWAHLDAVARVSTTARTVIAPVGDADGVVLMQLSTALGVGLPAGEGRSVPLQVLHHAQPLPLARDDHDEDSGMTVMIGERAALGRALGQEEPDEVSKRMFALQQGDHVRVAGDLYLPERMPDDKPGADLQLLVQTLERL